MNWKFGLILGAIGIAFVALIAVNVGEKSKKPLYGVDYSAFDWRGIIDESNIPESFKGDKNIVLDRPTGDIESEIVLVEWLNFQCEGCYSLSAPLEEIVEEYQDRVAFVFRVLIQQGHANGTVAAIAAEAAGNQGKYFEMKDLIFRNYVEWSEVSNQTRDDALAGLAEQLGLDMDRWREDVKNNAENGIRYRLDFQSNLADQAFDDVGESGYTPFVTINGEVVKGAEEIREKLDSLLKENDN